MGDAHSQRPAPVEAESPPTPIPDPRSLAAQGAIAARLATAIDQRDMARATQDAAQIDGAFGAVSDDEDAIYRAIRGKSSREIAALRAAYAQRGRGTLDTAIARLDSNEQELCRFLLQGTQPPKPEAHAEDISEDDVRREQARRDAVALFDQVDSVFSDEEAMLGLLAGRSKTDVALLREAYREHYGRDLETDLEESLDEDEMKLARAHLAGDPAKAAAEVILTEPGEEELIATLRRLSPEDRAKTVGHLAAQGKVLDDLLREELEDEDLLEAQALMAGDAAKADAARLKAALGGIGTDDDALERVLGAARSEEDRQRMLAAYVDLTGRSLDEDIEDDTRGATESRLRALAAGDQAGIVAGKLGELTSSPDLSPEQVVSVLESVPPESRAAALARYEEEHGHRLDQVVGAAGNDRDVEAVRQAGSEAGLDPSFALYWSMKGLGTKEGRLHGTLDGLSKEDARAAARRYEAATGRSLEDDVEGDTSGRDESRAKRSLGGRPETTEEMLDRADAEWDDERGEGAGLLGGLTDVFYDSGRAMDWQHERLASLRGLIATEQDPIARAALLAQARQVVAFQSQDRDMFAARQERVADTAGMVAQMGGTLAFMALTGGGGAGAWAQLMKALGPAGQLMVGTGVGGGLQMLTKRGVMGEAYGAEAFGGDLAVNVGAIPAAGLLASGRLVKALPDWVTRVLGPAGMRAGRWGRLLSSPGTREAVTQGILGAGSGTLSGLTAGFVDERTYEPGGGQSFFGTLGAHVLGGLTGGLLSGRLDAATHGRWKNLAPGWRAFWQGTAGNALGGLGRTAVTPGTFEGEPAEIAARLAMGALPDAVHGGLGARQRAKQKTLVEPSGRGQLSDVDRRLATPTYRGATTPAEVHPHLELPPVGASREQVIAYVDEQRQLRARHLQDEVDYALDDPERAAILRRDHEDRLRAELAAEAAQDIGPKLRERLGGAKDNAEFQQLLRKQAEAEGRRRFDAMEPAEQQERLRRSLHDEAEARAAREVNERVAAELRERNRVYNDESYGKGFTEKGVAIDPETGASSLGTDKLVAMANKGKGIVSDFAVIGAGLPAATDVVTRQDAGEGKGTVISADLGLWHESGEMVIGQRGPNIPIHGLDMQPGLSPNRYAAASEAALASNASLLANDARMLEGTAMKLETRPVNAEGWPDGATSRVLVKRERRVTGPDGKVTVDVQAVWHYSKGPVDIAGGMGAPNRWTGNEGATVGQLEGRTAENGYQIDPSRARLLTAEDQLRLLHTMRGPGGKLNIPPALREHGVVVQSGSPTAAWTASELAKLGIPVRWLSRHTPGGEVAPMLSAYGSDAEIKKQMGMLHAAQGQYAAALKALKERALLVSKHNPGADNFLGLEDGGLRKELANAKSGRDAAIHKAIERLEQMRDAAKTDRERLAIERVIGGISERLDPFDGAQLRRNHDLIGTPNVAWDNADVLFTKPLGDDRLQVYLSDGRVLTTGRMLSGIGATNLWPDKVAEHGKLKPIADAEYTTRRERLRKKAEETLLGDRKPEDLTEEERAQIRAEAEGIAARESGRPEEIFGFGNDHFRLLGAGGSPHGARLLDRDPTKQYRNFYDPADYENSMEFWRARSQSIDDVDSRGVTVGIRSAVHDRPLRMTIEAMKVKERELAGRARTATDPTEQKALTDEHKRLSEARRHLEGRLGTPARAN